MAVRLRLKRMGRTNLAFFRLCAFDSRTRRDGRAIEYLGWYDPRVALEEKKYSLNRDRIQYWLAVGAKPTVTVQSILVKHGIPVPGTERPRPPTAEEKATRVKAREARKQKRQEAVARKAARAPAEVTAKAADKGGEAKKEKREAKRG